MNEEDMEGMNFINIDPIYDYGYMQWVMGYGEEQEGYDCPDVVDIHPDKLWEISNPK